MSPGIVAESDLTGALKSEYVFFAGERVARKDFSGSTTSVFYYFSDHLKTASVITDSAGTIKEDEDYYPWGGELQFVNNDSNHYKFTGKERDSETGLDYFGARYYGNWVGRFLTPDWAAKPITVPYANFGNPQSLNLYSYVKNNPRTLGDPDGHQSPSSCGPGCIMQLIEISNRFDADPGGFGKALAIGAVKGLGRTVLHTGQFVGAATLTSWMPPQQSMNLFKAVTPSILTNAVTPSNDVEAVGSKGAQVGVAAASLLLPFAAPSEAATAAAETTTLFRAIAPAEAESIESLGAFSASPTGSLFKGFFFAESDASSFAARMTEMTGDTHTVIGAEASTDLVNASATHNAATEGPGVLIKNEDLPQIKVKNDE